MRRPRSRRGMYRLFLLHLEDEEGIICNIFTEVINTNERKRGKSAGMSATGEAAMCTNDAKAPVGR